MSFATAPSRRLAALLCLVLAAPSCGSSEPEPSPPLGDPACDNLDTSACLFPFPSDFFRRPGGPHGQATHLDFGTSMPMNEARAERMSPEPFRVNDGYPVVSSVTFVLEGASLAGAPPLEDIGASLSKASKTLVIDAETGEPQPHWAELDYQAEEAGARVVQLRLADALGHGKRYIVAVRGLVDDAGALVAATPGFAALRDGSPADLAGVEERRARFDAEVFTKLESFGVARSELQLAWDFTTSTEAGSTTRLLTMRDALYAQIGQLGPEYSVTKVVADPDGPDGPIAKIIEAVAKVPSFMLPFEPGYPRRLRLDEAGLPRTEGFEDVPFRVQIPRVALTGEGKVAVMQYGHGFLGSDGEANNGWLRDWAARHGFLILSADMQGMNTSAAIGWFVRLPEDATNMAHIAEEPLQGIINHFALQRLMKGRFVSEPNVQRDGEPLYDPARLHYHGNSQGGTMGNLIVLPSLDMMRGVLGVPGVSIGFILARASQWQEMAGALAGSYTDPHEFVSVMSLAQVGWDKCDGINFAPRWADLPGTPPKQILLQTALEDAQVNNDVSRLLARLYKAKLVAPAVQEVWGLEEAASPIVGQNGCQEIDFGVAPREHTNRPASTETDTHGLARKLPKIQDQGWHFMETGEIIATCDGICDPE